ncbi:MAG: hypothetical protein IIZ68_05610, partial [Clostridia bacterium]|nr:hypothetical protein [Clostridia bacterium]
MADNNYSNVIAPSDGVHRFLLRPSIMLLGLGALFYSVCAFRMNGYEHTNLGGSLRSTMMFIACVIVPLGILTAGVFSRTDSMGMAYTMISLSVASLGLLVMVFNAISWMKHDTLKQMLADSVWEWLAFVLALAVFVNLSLSCMEYRLVPLLGYLGALFAATALLLTGFRTVDSFSQMLFAWEKDFDWTSFGEWIDSRNMMQESKWVFRAIPLDSPQLLRRMMVHRLWERISVCTFYGVWVLFFLDYAKEMKAFNKLLAHASEYVEIPTANIAASLAKTEKAISEKVRLGGGSVKGRLKKYDEMTKAAELGLDITAMSEEMEREREHRRSGIASVGESEDDRWDEEERPRRRRSREDSEDDRRDEEERPRRRRSREDSKDDRWDVEERPRRRRSREEPEDDRWDSEERPRRRRSREEQEDDRWDAAERPRSRLS